MGYSLAHYPAVRLLVLAVTGILCGLMLQVPVVFWLVSALTAALVALLAILYNLLARKRSALPSSFAVVFYCLFMVLAFALHASFSFRYVPSPSLISWVGREVILLGEVEGRPDHRAEGTGLQLRVSEVFHAGTTTKIDDRLKVFVRLGEGRAFAVQEGDVLRVKGRPGLIALSANRGEYDPRLQGRYRQLHVQLFCAGPRLVLHEEASPGFSVQRSLINPLRDYLAKAIDARFPAGSEAQFVKSMILGERDLLPDEMYDAFRRTGTAHVLAVSGLHVALLAYVVNLCLQRLKVTRFGRWFAFVLLLLILWLYSAVTGNSPSVLRAALMSAMMIGGEVLGRKGWPLNSLAACDLVILLWTPMVIFDAGFLMTNGAVAGIVVLYGPLNRMVPEGRGVWRTMASFVWSSLSVSLAAMIGVSPVIAWFFGTFSVAGILANLPVVLFSNMAMYAAMPLFFFNAVAADLASLFGMSSWLFAQLTLFFTFLFNRMPMSSIGIRPELFEVVLFYVVLVAALFALFRRAWAWSVIVLLFGANVVLWHHVFSERPPPPAILTVNLGKNLAVFCSSGSETVLVDAGRRPKEWDRIMRQAEVYGLPKPCAAVQFLSPDSVISRAPVARTLSASGSSLLLKSMFISRPAEKVLRISGRRQTLLMVSGIGRLLEVDAGTADVVMLWVYRFDGKQWRQLDSWHAARKPARMVLVPGPFMSASGKFLLAQFAARHSGTELRQPFVQTLISSGL